MVQPATKRLVTESQLEPLKGQVTAASVAAALPSRLSDATLGATYGRRMPGIISAADPKFAGGVGYGRAAEQNRAALQSAIDSLKGFGGTVVIPAPEPPFAMAAFMDIDTVVLWARINLVGASKLGARLRAKPGMTTSLIKVGATDGTDSNWHWGEIRDLYLDGNKANQTARPLVTVTGAVSAGYVATLTTGAAHGITVGDVVQIAGILPDAYNGTWRVDSAPTPTTFTYGILTSAPAASTQAGTAQVMLDLIAVAEGGETSRVQGVYLNNAFNSGYFQGTNGTPMTLENVSAFGCDDWGFDLWCDRPILMSTPSGDFNGKGLIHLGGKSGSGGSGTDSAVTIVNIKAEHHLVPVVLIDDFDGSVTMIGGSIDMEHGNPGPANTGPAIRRTALSANSIIDVRNLRVNKRSTGAVFEDLSTGAQNITTGSVSTDSWTFMVGRNSMLVPRIAQKRNDITDPAGGATTVINLQNGTLCKINGTAAARVIGNPVNQPAGAPNGYMLVVTIKNAVTCVTTWSNLFLLGAAWSDPAAGKSKTACFWWDGAAYQLISVSPEF